MKPGTHWYQIGVIVLAVVCLWLSLKPQPAHAVVMVATCPQCGEMFRCENQGVMSPETNNRINPLTNLRDLPKTASDSTENRESGVESHHDSDYNQFCPATALLSPSRGFHSGWAFLCLNP